MRPALALLLLGLSVSPLLTGCGGDALARSGAMSEPPALRTSLSAVEALDYCDALASRPQKIDCFERVARGEDPSRVAQR
ncbi:hypothetical protein [Solimonas sp. SE-A11]|uniref:hypothetical protein n=1 Tax=Solimonas sp. SE-A11 TaxID=3054954 RepID=UPI00259D1CEA|nr:hypothetical protein [Solimonas sp. SE-A11]MDM4769445.1 hypothetical protein [Solimonas sp. SE-A11]